MYPFFFFFGFTINYLGPNNLVFMSSKNLVAIKKKYTNTVVVTGEGCSPP